MRFGPVASQQKRPVGSFYSQRPLIFSLHVDLSTNANIDQLWPTRHHLPTSRRNRQVQSFAWVAAAVFEQRSESLLVNPAGRDLENDSRSLGYRAVIVGTMNPNIRQIDLLVCPFVQIGQKIGPRDGIG
jgi:hypothetical protein